jgi:hypothetical protein
VDILINDKSGTAGIAWWINKHLKLTEEMQMDKKHPGVIKLAKWVQNEYDKGRITAIIKPAKQTATAFEKLLLHHEVIIPVTKGKLDLGTWQQIFHLECDVKPRDRQVVVTLHGD